MPKNVVTTDLNPNSEYPICRFQVVEHTEDKHALPNGSIKSKPHKSDHIPQQPPLKNTHNISQTIASMHQRANELLSRLIERRQSTQKVLKTTRNRSHPSSRTETSKSALFVNTQFHLDSGGSVHGPMDQKHSTHLGNISRSGHLIPGSRHYLTNNAPRFRSTRRQSDSMAWDVRSESAFRGRTYSESRRPYSSERTNEISSSSRYYTQHQRPYHFRTTASHNVSALSPPAHISRWSSMQTAGSHGLWRGPSSGSSRYATTLTRHHIKRHHEPVEMLVKHAPSTGTSKVNLVSIDTRRDTSPPVPTYSPSVFTYNQFESERSTQRERHLQEELISARRELQELKRSRSLTGEQDLLSSPIGKQTVKSTSTQYLNEGTWTTHTLRKNDGLPCGARISTSPYRASSQTNIAGRNTLGRQQWASDMNIRKTTYKQPPMLSTYSAHRENLQRKEEQRKLMEDGVSARYYEDSKTPGGAEVLEEVETITLQPIGRGVHDLEPTGSIARSYRPYTPTVPRGSTPGIDQQDAYRTIATTNLHRETQSSNAYSPYVAYPTSNSGFITGGTEQRYRSTQHSEPHYRATTVPPNYAASTSGASGYGEGVEMKHVQDTSNEWYLPDKSREEVNLMLRDREPGAFVIRSSVSCANGFSLGMKAPPYPPQISTNPDYLRSGLVKHYLIATVPIHDGRGDGVQLGGFNEQPIFPSLAAFVHHHCLHPGPLPCVLRLPPPHSGGQYRAGGSLSMGKYGLPLGGSGIMADMLYLGSVPVDRLENAAAVRMAVTHVLGLAGLHAGGVPKRCEVVVHANPQEGVRFNDRQRRIVNEHIKPTKLIFCGLDPENRTYIDKSLEARGTMHARTFGIVMRKKRIVLRENVVHVFSELDPNQSAVTLVRYIKQTFSSWSDAAGRT